MSAIAPVRMAAPPSAGPAGPPPAAPQAPPSLLTEPATPTLAGMQDAMSVLYGLLTKMDEAGTAQSKLAVTEQTDAKADALQKTQDALDKQIQAQKDAQHAHHGFWHALGTVGKIVGVAAAAVGTVLTVGAASPALALAVVAVSVSGSVLQETGWGGAAGGWIGLGLTIAGSVGTLGLGAASQAASGTLSTVGHAISAGGDVASGAGAVASGVENKEAGDATARADDAAADGVQARQEMTQRQAVIEDLLDVMTEVHKSHEGALQSLQEAMQTQGQTRVGVAAQIGRA